VQGRHNYIVDGQLKSPWREGTGHTRQEGDSISFRTCDRPILRAGAKGTPVENDLGVAR